MTVHEEPRHTLFQLVLIIRNVFLYSSRYINLDCFLLEFFIGPFRIYLRKRYSQIRKSRYFT